MNWFLACLILWLFSMIYLFIDDLITDIIYKFHKEQDYESRSYSSVDEMIEEYERLHPIKNTFRKIHYFFVRISNFPSTSYDEIKYFLQRGVRGYSDRDCWSIDWYLTDILPKMLTQLKRNQNILPTWEEGKDEEVCKREWNYILDNIIWTFKIARFIQNNYWHYQESCNYDYNLAQKMEKVHTKLKEANPKTYQNSIDLKVMSKEECQYYEQGWKYFQKYFFSLWD